MGIIEEISRAAKEERDILTAAILFLAMVAWGYLMARWERIQHAKKPYNQIHTPRFEEEGGIGQLPPH